MSEFSCIGLVGRVGSEHIQYSLKRLSRFLKKRDTEVLLDEETSSLLPGTSLEVAPRATLAERCDLVIVVGGDGSLLSAARFFAGSGVKILGINRGRLGFLTDISPEEIEYRVGEVLDGNYVAESRFLLESKVYRGEETISQGLALNDIVIHPGKFIRMIEVELSIDDEFVYRLRSDGMIVSSPTGSTAYALSCSGPIVQPGLDAVVLVPMNPHTLSSRPIVVKGDSKIRVVISMDNNLNPHVTCDGQTHIVTEPGDVICAEKSEKKLELIHPLGHNFYETCRSKLGWASHTQK